MTTQVLCTVPQGLKGLLLGPGGTAIDLIPPASADPVNGILLNSPALDNVGYTFTVDATAFASFANSALGKSLLTQGTPPALIAMN
jgi:hypothetical protein